MRTILFIGIIILTGTGGEIAVSHSMKQIGEVHVFNIASLVHAMNRVIRTGWIWAGIGLMAAAFFSLLALLSWADVSFVVPATALSYVVGALGAHFLLHERVSAARWTGVLLVCLGVALLSLS
jgi:drug/metabolite transporter (DMT)-like permease